MYSLMFTPVHVSSYACQGKPCKTLNDVIARHEQFDARNPERTNSTISWSYLNKYLQPNLEEHRRAILIPNIMAHLALRATYALTAALSGYGLFLGYHSATKLQQYESQTERA